MRIRAAGASHLGNVELENEDTFVVDEDSGFFGVCDGLGGHEAGEVAASVALEAIHRAVRHRPWVSELISEGKLRITAGMDLLDKGAEAANSDVFTLAKEWPRYSGMCCTLTGLLAVGDQAALVNVGDSRFYHVRKGVATQVTLDHTLGEECRRAETPQQPPAATTRELLSKAIGFQEFARGDLFPLAFEAGDRFLICTDGFSDHLPQDFDLALAIAEGSPHEVVRRLIGQSIADGGLDNATVVVGVVDE